MFGLSVAHLLIILVIVLLIRARKLPEIVGNLSMSVKLFKRGLRGESLEQSPPRKEQLGVREPDDILPKK
jgi:Sec-independent protein translocase protein TatA